MIKLPELLFLATFILSYTTVDGVPFLALHSGLPKCFEVDVGSNMNFEITYSCLTMPEPERRKSKYRHDIDNQGAKEMHAFTISISRNGMSTTRAKFAITERSGKLIHPVEKANIMQVCVQQVSASKENPFLVQLEMNEKPQHVVEQEKKKEITDQHEKETQSMTHSHAISSYERTLRSLIDQSTSIINKRSISRRQNNMLHSKIVATNKLILYLPLLKLIIISIASYLQFMALSRFLRNKYVC